MAQVDYDNGELVFVHERSFLDKCTEIRHLFNASNIRVTIVLAIGGWLICNLNIYSLNFYVNGILEIYEFASSNIYKATMINAFATIIGYFAAFFSVRFIGYCATIALRLMLIAGFAIGFGLSSTDQAIIITCWFFECFLFLVFGTFYSLTPPTYRSHFGTNTVRVCEATTRAVGICFPYIFNALLTSHKDSIIIPSSLVAGVDILVALLVMLIVFKTRDQKRFTEV
eukprot:Nk52_evm1s91 gene=Nk52_evmTU1s91